MSSQLAEQAGLLWTWWRGDPLPPLQPIPHLEVSSTWDAHVLNSLFHVTADELQDWQRNGHQPYIALIDGAPVAVGISGYRHCIFGEPQVAFTVPEGERYLYYCITLPDWRGRGIYPQLLQHIIRSEQVVERFWIIHQLANVASQRGIAKAGFSIASKVYFLTTRKLVLLADGEAERASTGASLLGLPTLDIDTQR